MATKGVPVKGITIRDSALFDGPIRVGGETRPGKKVLAITRTDTAYEIRHSDDTGWVLPHSKVSNVKE